MTLLVMQMIATAQTPGPPPTPKTRAKIAGNTRFRTESTRHKSAGTFSARCKWHANIHNMFKALERKSGLNVTTTSGQYRLLRKGQSDGHERTSLSGFAHLQFSCIVTGSVFTVVH